MIFFGKYQLRKENSFSQSQAGFNINRIRYRVPCSQPVKRKNINNKIEWIYDRQNVTAWCTDRVKMDRKKKSK